MMCYAWHPNPSYSTSPPCGQPAEAAPAAEQPAGLFGLSWLTIALIGAGAIWLLSTERRRRR